MNTRIILVVLPILVGIGAFYLGRGHALRNSIGEYSSYNESRENPLESSFTNPLLECSFGQDYIAQNTIRPSKEVLEKVITEKVASRDITHASVYYRDLNNGPWLGINEKENFFPASLMKVPLAMYFYKRSEEIPGLLDSIIPPNKDLQTIDFEQHFKPSQSIDLTKAHTIRKLLEASIKHSDNKAAEALVFATEKDGFRKLLEDLHLSLPQSSDADFMNVRDYATFFRVLFNASYLSKHNSEELLSTLSETEFDKGITKYLPRDTVVSHKFGERYSDSSNIKQFHDCGIVYLPYHPYLICIMTRGTDMDKASDVASLLSKVVYQEALKQVSALK
ncbi:MAG: serine hydrolase [Patescibacteria group bacterium]